MSDDIQHIEGPKLRCDCTCSVLGVDFDRYGGEETWIWDFYTQIGYAGSWRHRLRIIWNLLRGKDHYFHGTVHTVEDMRKMRDFLNATLPSEQGYRVTQVTTTSGSSAVGYPINGTQ